MKLLSVVSVIVMLSASYVQAADTPPAAGKSTAQKMSLRKTNVIYLIGDGMGVWYTSAYRYFSNHSVPPQVDRTIYDEMLVGSASTFPDDDELEVTDSAAAGTALACGIKTYDTAIAVDKQHHPVKSMLDIAKENGYLTGIAVTSHLNDATPAVFVAHSDSRRSLNEIADQFIDLKINGKPKVDLMLGGGRSYYVRDDRNLESEFSVLGYNIITDLNQLPQLKKLPVFGLFAPKGLPFAVDSDHPLRLKEMTEKALDLLQTKPFFLMLEASQVDWCGHGNDIVCAMGEMNDMAETMKVIKAFIDKNPNTILVVTADHSTGGLSIGANGEYNWRPGVIKKIKATAATIVDHLLAHKNTWSDEWQSLTSIALNDSERKDMQAALAVDGDNARDKVNALVLTYISKYSATGWTTHGHTGEDVQVFSYGNGRNNFAGSIDNTDIAKRLITIITH